jgi:hypothetical protein
MLLQNPTVFNMLFSFLGFCVLRRRADSWVSTSWIYKRKVVKKELHA